MNISELIKQEVGTKPASARGVVKAVGKTHKFNTGHVQNITLGDPDGDQTLLAKLWNRDPLTSSDIGCVMEWTGGLTLKEDEYQGKKRIYLNITERAEQNRIMDDTDEIPMHTERAETPSGQSPTWVGVGKHLERLGALYAACYAQASGKLANEIRRRTMRDLSDEDIRQIATTLFIQTVGLPLPPTVWAHYGEAPPEAPRKPTSTAQSVKKTAAPEATPEPKTADPAMEPELPEVPF